LPRRVLYLVDGLGLSGKTRTMAYLAAHLDPAKYAAAVCRFSTEDSVLATQLAAHGVPVHTVSCRDGLDVAAIRRVLALARGFGANVIHCYNPRPILYGGIAGLLARIPCRIGSLSAFACQVPDRTYGFLPQPLTTSSRRNVVRNRIAARLMRYLVAVSEPLGRRFFEYNGLPLDKLRIVSYGADLSAVERVTPSEAATLRRELGFDEHHVVVGSVGRLVEQKDYPTQLRAFATAAARFPQLRMVLAGDGPLAGPLRELVTTLGIEPQVRFLGHWERVPALLKSLDVFVLASKFEPFGVALLEAKAAGVAIVATAVNEIPAILDDQETGLLVPAEDAAAMAATFGRLADDAPLRKRLGARAMADARARHGLQNVVDSYQRLYDSCLAGAR
jgi:glycosyltransferase involved in cell wall biosynthesis